MNNEKNIYVEARKQSNLTQARASEAMQTISEDRLARLETDKISMTPNDVLEMSNAYKRPDLCNYYCTHECPIGKSTLSEIKPQQLSNIILKMIASLNTALAMFLLGMLFTGFKAIDKTLILRVVRVCIIKDVVAMLVVLSVLYGAFRLFANVDEIRLMCYVCYIAALCPVGMSVSSFAVIFNKDESYSGLLVLVTSVICVVTLPLSVALAEKIF